ncbi:cyclic lactone autoinducer peptide [Clostridium aestuarii]|uniref:Cyclic lactone autoinducer peptide n=1 Tax=Clostridium aestuarii TaxID=338193 RepID=A0ABT4D0L9_9CLOT|nr:cyclic lactone autoinducer peptide [Clostridium aestuarii]MCY6484776.1 cyclic lactone autoinducer peptide [Clostridium aestuarii]
MKSRFMKTMVTLGAAALTFFAFTTSASACTFFAYQPKEPKALREE